MNLLGLNSMLLFILISIKIVNANIWCYSCVSSQPGCDETYVDWRIHKAETCPEQDDKCVKIIEKRNDETFVTRDCLSKLIGLRPDIPADTFEGCRPAASTKLAIHVDNNIEELDLKRNYYKQVEYCFCEFDEWCNKSSSQKSSFILISFSFLLLQLILF